MGMNVREYSSSGTFTVPAGVTGVLVFGVPGGSGGISGLASNSTIPNGFEFPMSFLLAGTMIEVIPNTTYTVTIGQGGIGGAATASSSVANPGTMGTASSFGSLVFKPQTDQIAFNQIATESINSALARYTSGLVSPGMFNPGDDGLAGAGSYRGGAGAPAGSFGLGANGGNGNGSGAGATGSNAAFPGGCGGQGGYGSTGGGAGGDGADGYIIVVWAD